MSQLLRAIFINSYSKGRIVVIDKDGHTNLNGTNGVGKTTLLSCMPIFYGVRPGNLVQAQGGGRDSFTKHYLYHPSSFVVFEYLRDGKVVSVIISAQADKVLYQFVDMGYQESFFTHESNGAMTFCTPDMVKSNIESAGHYISAKMGADTYANVIQSNARPLARSNQRELVASLRPRFSFPVAGGSIKGVESVLKAILKREPDFDSIQQLMTSILLNDGVIDNDVVKLKNEQASITSWERSFRAWNTVDKIRPEIAELSNLRVQLMSEVNALSSLQSNSASMLQTLTEDKQKTDVSLTNRESELHRFEKEHRAQKNLKEDGIRDLGNEIKDTQRAINQLNQTKQDFMSGTQQFLPLDELRLMLSREEDIKTRKRACEDSLAEIRKGISDIELFFSNDISRHQSEIQNLQIAFEKMRQEKSEENNESKDNLKLQSDQNSRQLRKSIDSRQANLNADLRKLEARIASFKEKLNNFHPEQADQELINEAEDELNLDRKHHRETLRDYQATLDKLNHKKEDRKSVEREFQSIKNEIRRLNELKGEQQSLLHKSSLFSFVQANLPGESERIAKCINTALMTRRDLRPELVDPPANSIFGLGIDHDQLPAVELRDKEQVEQRKRELDEQIGSRELTEDGIYKRLEALNKDIHELEQQLIIDCTNTDRLHKAIDDRENELQALKIQVQANVDKRHTHIKASIVEFEQSLSRLNKEQQQLQTDFDREETLLQEVLSKALDKLEEDYQASLEKMTAQHNTNLNNTSAKIDNLQRERETAIKEKGVSTDALKNAEKYVSDLTEQMNLCITAKRRLEDYDSFIKNDWSKLPELQFKLSDNKATYDAHTEELGIFKKQGLDKQKELNSFIKSTKEKQNKLIKEISEVREVTARISQLISHYPGYTSTEDKPPVKANDASQLAREYSKLKAHLTKIKDIGFISFKSVKTAFCKTTETAERNFFDQLNTINDSLITLSHDLHWYCLADDLSMYMQESHETHKEKLKTEFSLVAQGLANFSVELEEAHKHLSGLGRKLNKTLHEVASKFDVFSLLEIKVSSQLKELNYWDALKDFREQFEHFLITSASGIPDDNLIGSLLTLGGMVDTSQRDVKLSKSFNFAVRMQAEGDSRLKEANKTAEIMNLDSNGLSYLIVIAVYVALIELLRSDSTANISIYVDELGDLAAENVGKLINLLDQHNLTLVSGFPDVRADILTHFKYPYVIYPKPGSRSIRVVELVSDSDLMTPSQRIEAGRKAQNTKLQEGAPA